MEPCPAEKRIAELEARTEKAERERDEARKRIAELASLLLETEESKYCANNCDTYNDDTGECSCLRGRIQRALKGSA
jgi:hypothetical protein